MCSNNGNALAMIDVDIDNTGYRFYLSFEEQFAAAARHPRNADFCVEMFGFGHRYMRRKVRGFPFFHTLKTIVSI